MTGQFRGTPRAIAVLIAIAAPMGNITSAGTVRVEVKGLAFAPAQISAHVGDTIEWMNDDFVVHTATARNGQWDVKLPPHATGRTVVNSVGTVPYYCRYHQNMKAEITVVPQ
jgi:plastocyanin